MNYFRTTCENVAKAWASNREASNHGGTMRTNGRDLFSYDLRIGYTTEGGRKVLLDYTASTGNFVSMTTSSKHISPTRRYATDTISPTILQNTDKESLLKRCIY